MTQNTLDKGIKLRLHTTFQLAHYENVQRLVMALVMSGYYVNVRGGTSGTTMGYDIYVYKI